ncbi:PRC-barrel domain-containing protein [Lunatibacter salilacus]|uniref:PRC-barrel domain-containing protein n=1 Tax=Lunatibacter salilacus TaxID=2483804 RepID=UPI00131E812F|nr:PRC-barrel domain-containing protein [Lunatibacter salilacus]
MSENKKNLYYLDDLSGYKVASDYNDVRGWEVKDADNRRIGKVDRLLANKETKRVVYLDIEVDESVIADGHEVYDKPASDGAHEFLNKDGESHLIIPIGMVRLDEQNKHVISDTVDYSTFSKTKRIGKGVEIDRDYEVSVLGQYSPEQAGDEGHQQDEGFYDRQVFKRPEDRR